MQRTHCLSQGGGCSRVRPEGHVALVWPRYASAIASAPSPLSVTLSCAVRLCDRPACASRAGTPLVPRNPYLTLTSATRATSRTARVPATALPASARMLRPLAACIPLLATTECQQQFRCACCIAYRQQHSSGSGSDHHARVLDRCGDGAVGVRPGGRQPLLRAELHRHGGQLRDGGLRQHLPEGAVRRIHRRDVQREDGAQCGRARHIANVGALTPRFVEACPAQVQHVCHPDARAVAAAQKQCSQAYEQARDTGLNVLLHFPSASIA